MKNVYKPKLFLYVCFLYLYVLTKLINYEKNHKYKISKVKLPSCRLLSDPIDILFLINVGLMASSKTSKSSV